MSQEFEVRMYTDQAMRDRAFESLRSGGEPNEKQVVKWSDSQPVMKSEEEFQLDDKGRVVWRDVFYLSYPREASGWKRLKEAANANA